MRKIQGFFACFIPLVSISVSEAAGEIEKFILRDPAALRKFFTGVVLVLGVTIIIMRAFFNRRIVKKSAGSMGAPRAKSGTAPSAGQVNLKPAKLLEMHENREHEIPMDRALTIGRVFENAVVIRNPAVSRHHAKIIPEPEGYIIYDLGSKKGTFVNGEMVSRRILKNSDIIEIAREDFMFTYR